MDNQEQEQNKWQLIGETPGGYGLYRKPNGVGGYQYTTDEIPTGWIMYDSAWGSMEVLFAITEDHRQCLKDYHERESRERTARGITEKTGK